MNDSVKLPRPDLPVVSELLSTGKEVGVTQPDGAQGRTYYHRRTRRHMMLLIHPETLVHVLQRGIARKIEGKFEQALFQNGYQIVLPAPIDVPTDARVLEVAYLPSYHAFGFVIEHESFAEVPGCEQMPVRHVQLEAIFIPPVK